MTHNACTQPGTNLDEHERICLSALCCASSGALARPLWGRRTDLWPQITAASKQDEAAQDENKRSVILNPHAAMQVRCHPRSASAAESGGREGQTGDGAQQLHSTGAAAHAGTCARTELPPHGSRTEPRAGTTTASSYSVARLTTDQSSVPGCALPCPTTLRAYVDAGGMGHGCCVRTRTRPTARESPSTSSARSPARPPR